MIKQIKKRSAALIILFFAILDIFILPYYAFVARNEKDIVTVSDVAEQKSVINEQAVEEIYSEGWTTTVVNLREEPTIESEIVDKLEYNTHIYYTTENEEWDKVKWNGGYAYIKDEYINDTENEPLSPYNDLIEELNDNDKYLICQITFLEAGNQSMEGQRAVIEVILNRVLSDKYPDTVEGVLSQPGQFATWSYKTAKSHNETQKEALLLVSEEEPILSLEHLMFSRGKFSYGKNYIKIQDHWFGTF